MTRLKKTSSDQLYSDIVGLRFGFFHLLLLCTLLVDHQFVNKLFSRSTGPLFLK